MNESAQTTAYMTDAARLMTRPETSRKIDKDELEQDIISALKTVYDPEIPVNIYDLG